MNAKTDTPATAVATGDKLPFGDVSADGWDTITVDKTAKALAEISDDPFGTLAELYGNEGSWPTRLPGRGLVVVFAGDSNTKGRPGFETASNSGVRYELTSATGVWEGATTYNKGENGSLLSTWVARILTGNGSTTADGEAWAVKNLDPDFIVCRLGTNDVNNASNRATIGTEATLRANLGTLLRWWLDNTRATIILRTPRLSWNGETDFFAPGIPGWADVNDYREAQRRLNVVYREWRGRTPRVLVIDPAKYYGDDYCDDKTANQLDPVTGGATMSDSLHDSDLGYRIECELIAHAMSPVRYPVPRASATVLVSPEEVYRDSYWSMSCYLKARNVSLLSFEHSPQHVFDGRYGVPLNQARTVPVTRIKDIELLRACGYHPIYLTLRNLPAVTGGYGLVFWSSGRVYTFDSLTFSSLTTADDPDYSTFTVGGITPASNAGDVEGPITIFARKPTAIPFSPYSSRVATDRQLSIPAGQTTTATPLLGADVASLAVKSVLCARGEFGGGLTLDLKLCNQADGRYVGAGAGSPYATGKVFARATFSAGIYTATATLDPDGEFGGAANLLFTQTDFIRASVTSGTVTGALTAVIAWR